MMIGYPIKFRPILQDKIWGGNKLKEILKKDTSREQVGESWEISGVEGNISVVANGEESGKDLKSLIGEFKASLVGDKIYRKFGDDFPLLIKFIDARTDLSVQLHPGDELAKQRHNSFGKTEMWYVLQADEGSRLNIGFKKDLDKLEYIQSLEEGKITELLHFEEVTKGDAFFINTGKVHAIGGGILLAEIQQTSDITYRIYDWDRVDSEGNARELHTKLALDAIDFGKKDDYKLEYEQLENRSNQVAACDYFITNFIPLKGSLEKDYSTLDSFVIYMCLKGVVKIDLNGNIEKFKKGETMLIPALAQKVTLEAENAELLEVFIR